LKIAAALVLTSPFVPMLFQGEEWGALTPFQYFTDHVEPELANAVREGRRKEFVAFGWKPEEVPDPQALTTFERSKLKWSELEAESHAALIEWHRELIQLRRREAALNDGRRDLVKTRFDESARWLVVQRGPIRIACSFSGESQRIPLGGAKHAILLASEETIKADGIHVILPPDSVVILKA
jgi:maltooligosyltrehalose trehalohydrolase